MLKKDADLCIFTHFSKCILKHISSIIYLLQQLAVKVSNCALQCSFQANW